MQLFVNDFKFFSNIIGKKVYISLFLIVLATIFEGIGIALFFPLLKNGVAGDDSISNITVIFLERFDLEYSVKLMLIIMVLVFFVRAVLLIFQRIYNASIVSSMRADILSEILDGYFQSDYNYHLSKKSGYIVNAVARELPSIAAAFTTFVTIVSTIIISTVYFSIPLILNPESTLYLMIFGSIMFAIMVPVNRYLKKASLEYSEVSARLQNYVIQALSSYKYLKSTNTFSPILKKLERSIDKVRRIQYLQDGFLHAIPYYGMEFLSFVAIIGLIYYQSVVNKQDIELMLFVLFLLYRAVSLLLSLQMQYRKLISYSGSIVVYNDLKTGVDSNQEVVKKDGVPVDMQNDIFLKDVSFKYKNSDNLILHNINMKIACKSTVGIVGESGAGKSTLMSLLTATLKPDNGVLKIGEHSYDDFNILDVRSKIGYVTQENIIFNDTIFNNISLWEQNADRLKVEASSKMALAYDFIMEQPEKFEQQLGDNGVNLSGGQRQRITIARELYKNSELLIFDEATSALDSESEREIQRSIHQLKGKKTILIIAHRLFTLKECDIIYLFKKGRIIASGSFDELLSTSEVFKQMCTTQNLE